jgi:histidine triad (HIT) family protein
MSSTDCIFCKIVRGEIPCSRVYEDEHFVAFDDISPQAPVHVLIVPREHIETLEDLTADHALLAGRSILVGQSIARARGLAPNGYRLVYNCGKDAGQAVFHIHLHLLGGRPMKWPPG